MVGRAETRDIASVSALDPDIRTFVNKVIEHGARLRAGRDLPVVEVREIAEIVRAPWVEGGPVMAATDNLKISHHGAEFGLRIYRPAACDTNAALIYMHGGGFMLFSLDTHDRIMREYADRAKMIVIGVDYALSPEAKFPVALEQVCAAILWAHAQADALGIDTDKIFVGGDSAGANLAMAASIAMREEGCGDAVKGMLLNYGAFSVECSPKAIAEHGGPGAMLTSAEMDVFWSNYLNNEHQRALPLVNLIDAALEQLPPAHIAIAECDVLAEQNEIMAQRLAAAGVPVSVAVYEGATHSFLEAVSISPLSDKALSDAAAWLRQMVAGAGGD